MSDPIVKLHTATAELAVAPDVGGSIASFRVLVGGAWIDCLRPATPDALAARDPRRTGCFPLVPFSNRIRAGKFRFGGRDIQLPLNSPPAPHAIHGHGFQAAWRVVSHSDASLTIEHRYDEGPWPYPYVARQDFALGPDGLTVAMTVESLAGEAMPLGLGWHPYFSRTPKAGLTAAVGKMWRNDAETMPVALVDPPATHRLGNGIRPETDAMDNCFAGWNQRAVIEWPERGAGLTLTADPVFKFLVVFTPPGRDFFCAEPVSNCTDAFNLAAGGRDDTGMIVLPPGGSLRAAMRMAVTAL